MARSEWPTRYSPFANRDENKTSICRRLPSRKQDRRQPLAPRDRRFVGRTPGLEQLHELLAGAIVVPLAVAADDLDQVVERLGALAFGIEREREVEPRLVIERIGGNLLLQLGDRAEGGSLLGQLDRGADRRHRRVVALGLRHHRERLLGLVDRAGLE